MKGVYPALNHKDHLSAACAFGGYSRLMAGIRKPRSDISIAEAALDLSRLRALRTLTFTLVFGHNAHVTAGPWEAAMASLPNLIPLVPFDYIRLRVLIPNNTPHCVTTVVAELASHMLEIDLILAALVKARTVRKVQVALYGSVPWGINAIYRIAPRDLLNSKFPDLCAIDALELLA